MKIVLFGWSIAYVLMNVASCSKNEATPVDRRLALTDIVFADGDTIPYRYTCKALQQKSPQIAWVPSSRGSRSYTLIMDDPDAAAVVGYVWNHWLLYNIPADILSIPESQDKYGKLPAGVFRGTTNFGDTAYGGPCPPAGKSHTYVFTLYELDLPDLGLPRGATAAAVRLAMRGHIVDSAVYRGTFKN